MYLSIIVLPFLGSILVGLRGRTMGFIGAGIITTGCILVSACLSWVATYEVILSGSIVSINLFDWVTVGAEPLTFPWLFCFDELTTVMCTVVLTVSAMVHVYSMDYMSGDPHGPRFMSLLSLFTAFMIMLVTGGTLAIMFVGWEGIGVSSFLLIGFWFTRLQAVKSAVKAITINRVGDMFLTFGLFVAFVVFGSLSYGTMFGSVTMVAANSNDATILVIATLLMLVGAMAKSAQVPLHTWLAAAMEGPTPVSALIHAATLVTAGVYLMLRVSPMLEFASTTVMVIAFVGAVTAIFAATSGMAQNDIKRVIAYSTCSQIGYMFIALGLGQYNLALYHLANHAAFKALLFMAAGAVIHAFMDQQDMRRYGGLVNVLPFVHSALLLGSLSLMAMPYMTGWFSKDGILEMAVGNYQINGNVIYVIGTLVAGLTAFYSMRLVFMTFLVEPHANHTSYHHAHESNWYVIVPLVVLSGFAIVLGYLTSDLYRGMGSDFLAVVAATSPSMVTSVDAEFGAITLWKLMPLAFTVLGSLAAYWLYMTPTGTASLNRMVYDQWPLVRNLYGFLSRQWNYDSWVISVMILGGLQLGHGISKVMDRGILEAIGPYGLQQGFTTTGTNLTVYSTGIITDFAMYIVLGMLVLVTLFTVPGLPLLASLNSGVGVPVLAMLLMVNGVSAFMVMPIAPSDT